MPHTCPTSPRGTQTHRPTTLVHMMVARRGGAAGLASLAWCAALLLAAHAPAAALAKKSLPTDEDGVIEITDRNFERVMEKHSEVLFIEFYAPWCGHCKKFAPEFGAACKQIAEEDGDDAVPFGKVIVELSYTLAYIVGKVDIESCHTDRVSARAISPAHDLALPCPSGEGGVRSIGGRTRARRITPLPSVCGRPCRGDDENNCGFNDKDIVPFNLDKKTYLQPEIRSLPTQHTTTTPLLPSHRTGCTRRPRDFVSPRSHGFVVRSRRLSPTRHARARAACDGRRRDRPPNTPGGARPQVDATESPELAQKFEVTGRPFVQSTAADDGYSWLFELLLVVRRVNRYR